MARSLLVPVVVVVVVVAIAASRSAAAAPTTAAAAAAAAEAAATSRGGRRPAVSGVVVASRRRQKNAVVVAWIGRPSAASPRNLNLAPPVAASPVAGGRIGASAVAAAPGRKGGRNACAPQRRFRPTDDSLRRRRIFVGPLPAEISSSALSMALRGGPASGGTPSAAAASSSAPASISSVGRSAASLLSRVVGGVSSVLSTLIGFRPEKFDAAWRAASEAAEVAYVVPLILLGWGAVPLARSINFLFSPSSEGDVDDKEGGEEHENGGTLDENEGSSALTTTGEDGSPETADTAAVASVITVEGEDPFEGTYLYEAASHVSQASKIGLAVCAMRFLMVGLASAGVGWAERRRASLPRASAKVAYVCWASLRVRYFKRLLLAYAAEKEPDELGRLRVYDRSLNYVIYALTIAFLLDALSIPTGRGLRSVFAVGGVGSLVFGLASKELASHLVSGLALNASQKFFDGDKIMLGDGTVGKVLKVGALETELLASDDTVVRIPNSQIVNQRVSNLSRQKTSRVEQTLRFSYDDAHRVPLVLKEMKFQIQRSCPSLVDDGTRPFFAHWRDFRHDHLECVVRCHFRLSPGGEKYWDERQSMLRAIAKSAEKHGVKFAVPLNYNKNENVTPPSPSR